MQRRILLKGCCNLSLVGLLLQLTTQTAATAEGGGDRLLWKEARLAGRVTLREQQITIGELLEKVGAECGVALEADDRIAPISGYHVTAVFRECPARELLSALASLYRMPPDRWYWERTSRRGKRTYILRCTLPPEAELVAREEFGQQFRLDQRRRRAAYYAASPEVRARMARTDPMLAAVTPRSPGFFSFIAPLTDVELRSIANGQQIDIPAERWTPEQRAFIREEFRIANLLGRPGVTQPEELTQVRLRYNGEGTVVLDLGPVGAHGVLGGIWLQKANRENDLRRWVGDGDTTDAPDLTLPAPDERGSTRPEDLVIRGETADAVLFRLARLGRLNLLFDSPPRVLGHRNTPNYGLAGPLPQVLAAMGKQDLIWKRRGKVLLFRRPDWAAARTERVLPWAVVRDLRASAAANGGYLRPQDWLRLAAFDRAQLDSLSEEFPDAGKLAYYQLLLRLYGAMSRREQTACQRPQGAGWQDWTNETRRRLEVLYPPADARRAVLLVQWDTEKKPPQARFYMGSGLTAPAIRVITFEARREPDAASTHPRRPRPER